MSFWNWREIKYTGTIYATRSLQIRHSLFMKKHFSKKLFGAKHQGFRVFSDRPFPDPCAPPYHQERAGSPHQEVYSQVVRASFVPKNDHGGVLSGEFR